MQFALCSRHFVGVALSLILGHVVALEGHLFRSVGQMSSLLCVFYMSFWMCLLQLPLLCKSKQKWLWSFSDIGSLTIVGLGMGLALTLSITSYQYAPVADAFALYYSNAVFSLIIESIALKQLPHRLHIGAVLLAIIGIIIVSQPPFVIEYISSLITSSNETINTKTMGSSTGDITNDLEENENHPHRFFGCILAIFAAITTSVWMAFSRRIRRANIVFITFLQALSPVFAFLVYFNATGTPFCITGNLFMLALLCLNYSISLPLLNLCLQLEPSYVVTAVRCSATVTSYIIQIASGTSTQWYTFLGSMLIMVSVIIVCYTKWQQWKESPMSKDISEDTEYSI